MLFKSWKNRYLRDMPEKIISVEHAYKSFGSVKAVKDLSFTVEKASCFSFLGPNGAGKTTMMKILYGKAMPDRHDETVIDVFGYDPRRDELQIKYRSGMVPQEDSLDEELNVVQNLRIFAKFYRIPRGRTDDKIDELLGFLELGEKRDSKIKQLSGGMKRRLVLARSLLNEPDLLIMDEPTTGLDPQVRQLIWDKMRSLKKTGVTILLTTHYMEEAFQLADNLIIMDRGENILEGNPKTLLEEEIESFVLEITDKEAAGKAEKKRCGDGCRREESDQRIIYYSDDYEILQGMVRGIPPGDYYLRQITLEDLFLKATGRNLNEAQ